MGVSVAGKSSRGAAENFGNRQARVLCGCCACGWRGVVWGDGCRTHMNACSVESGRRFVSAPGRPSRNAGAVVVEHGERSACCHEPVAARAVYCAVDAAAAEPAFVGGVDNRSFVAVAREINHGAGRNDDPAGALLARRNRVGSQREHTALHPVGGRRGAVRAVSCFGRSPGRARRAARR